MTFKPGTGITGSHLNVNAVVPGLERRRTSTASRRRQGELPGLAGPRRRSRSRSRRRLPEPGGQRAAPRRRRGRVGPDRLGARRQPARRRRRVTTLVRRPAETRRRGRVADRCAPLDPAVLEGARRRRRAQRRDRSAGSPGRRTYKNTLLWSRITPTRALARAVRELGSGAPGLRLGIRCRVLRLGAGRAAHREVAARRDLPRRSVRRVGERRPRRRRPAEGRAAAHRARRAPRGRAEAADAADRAAASAGPIGRGTQKWPWISLDDEVRAIRHVIDSDIAGPGQPRRTHARRPPTTSASRSRCA